MKIGLKLLSFLIILVFLLGVQSQFVLASDIPSGVKPQEVIAVGTIPSSSGSSVDLRNGVIFKNDGVNLLEGDIVGIPIDINYTMTFYNVGEMGGSQYAKAVMTINRVAKGNGIKYVMFESPAHPGEPYLITKDNDTLPIIEPEVHFEGTFTGGPDGTFTGKTSEGKEITYILTDNGKTIKVQGKESLPLVVENPEAVWAGWQDTPIDSGAAVSSYSGQVEILLPGAEEDDWHLIKKDTVIPVGAHIRTQENSSVMLNFADLSTFVLKPESEIIITTPPEKESKIVMVAGKIWVNVKKIVAEGSMEVEMNQAVCGIKGTTFVCTEDGQNSTLKVIEGTVEYTSTADGTSLMVDAGNCATATSSGMGELQTFNVQDEQAYWDQPTAPQQDNANISEQHTPPYVLFGVITAVLVIIIALVVIVTKKRKHYK